MFAVKYPDGHNGLISTLPPEAVESFEFEFSELPPAPDDGYTYELVIDFDNHSFSLKKIEEEVQPEPENPEQPDSEQEVWDEMAQDYNEGFYEGVQQA